MAQQQPSGGNKGAGWRHDDGGEDMEMRGGGSWRRTTTCAVAALGLAGGGVLVWWALAFHPAREQLWMVPVGLVLLGTPVVAWLSLFASSGASCRLRDDDQLPPPA